MKKILILSLLFAQMASAQTIYDYIKPLPFDPHGWFGNQPQLERLFAEREIDSVIELGSWAGASTRFFGEKLRGKGIVLAVDTWRGSLNEELHREDPRSQYLYQLFLSNVKHSGLEEVIIPVRMTTDEASYAVEFQADLIYIDGDHATSQVIRDILNWYHHLKPGGVMCGDDWKWKSVQKGVKKAALQLNRQVEAEDNFWWFR